MVLVSWLNPNPKEKQGIIVVEREMFKLTGWFVAGSIVIIGILAALYTVFW
jgi:SSS family solute:Na+ symporter